MYQAEKNFFDYLVFYPQKGQDGYDGIHDGGIKGILKNAPEDVKQEYIAFRKEKEYARRQGRMI